MTLTAKKMGRKKRGISIHFSERRNLNERDGFLRARRLEIKGGD